MAEETELCRRRKAMGLSQGQLAALLGVTQATVSRNENATLIDRRFALALDALSARAGSGEDLAAIARSIMPNPAQAVRGVTAATLGRVQGEAA